MKKIFKKTIIEYCIVIILCVSFCSCVSISKQEYYSDIENFIQVTGIVSFINCNAEGDTVYIGFDELSSEFSDNCFKITGVNYDIVLENGLIEKVVVGKNVTFITAPKYYGNGYVMPIVSIAIEDDVLLEFEEGYSNFLNSLK